MCTPIGHSLFGATVYYFFNSSVRRASQAIEPKILFLYIFFANAPDLDFIPGIVMGNPSLFHHVVSHSILFILLAGLILAGVFKIAKTKNYFFNFGIIFLLLASHSLIDFFTEDKRPPIGVDLFWPYQKYFIAPYTIFPLFDRSLAKLLSVSNLKTLCWELFFFSLLFLIVFYLIKYRSKNKDRPAI